MSAFQSWNCSCHWHQRRCNKAHPLLFLSLNWITVGGSCQASREQLEKQWVHNKHFPSVHCTQLDAIRGLEACRQAQFCRAASTWLVVYCGHEGWLFSCFQRFVDGLMFYPLKVSPKRRIQNLSVQIPTLGEPFYTSGCLESTPIHPRDSFISLQGLSCFLLQVPNIPPGPFYSLPCSQSTDMWPMGSPTRLNLNPRGEATRRLGLRDSGDSGIPGLGKLALSENWT